MRKFLSTTLLLLALSCGTTITTQAQHLVVNLLSGQTEQYPVSEIQSIKFPLNSMVLYQIDGTVVFWNISDILNYEFDLTSLSATDGVLDDSNVLKIYPNPSSDHVHIEYTSREQGDVLIEVLEGSGKLIEVLYRGAHSVQTKTNWDIRASKAAPGTYLCRVSSRNKAVTGKIIVQ